MQSYNNTIR